MKYRFRGIGGRREKEEFCVNWNCCFVSLKRFWVGRREEIGLVR